MLSSLLKENRIRSFTEIEICKDRNIPQEYIENIIPTIFLLQRVRDTLNLPITINSSFRDEKQNKTVGGAKRSLHLVFNAIDFSVKSFLSSDYYQLASFLRKDKYSFYLTFKKQSIEINKSVLGIGCYKNFIHLDTRGLLQRKSPVFWIK